MHEKTSPLELSAEQMRAYGYRVIDLLVDRYASIRELSPWRGATRAELDAALREPVPELPGHFNDALDHLVRDVLSAGARVDHPRFMAFVPGAPCWPAVLGDLLAAGSNIFQGTWLASSGASAVELLVIDWFRQWLGYDDGAAGLLVSGGSVANLTGLACARISRFGAHDERAVIYCSAETHSSVTRAARVLGFDTSRMRVIATNDAEAIDVAALRATIAQDRARDLVPFVIVANAGTTSTGAIDSMHELADICEEEEMWLHVDAAYGGFAALTRRGRESLAGIERGDSIVLDPHKWLYQTFEVGCLLVRDGALLERAFHVMPPYLQDTALPDDARAARDGAAPALPVNFANRGIQLTRSARALKVWLSVQTFGTAAFTAAIDQCIDLALHAEQRIRDSTSLELLAPARLGIVCFRRRRDHDHDEFNHALLRALLDSGVAMISSTRVRGAFALRFCILNYRTTRDDIDRVLDWIEAFSPLAP
jgi:glutamate/tyrosine decarboxylase-like PLP-dependent enzyme